MAENLSKKKRDRMISFLEGLKKTHTDDASIRAFNEIENELREKKYGLVWEEHTEEVDDMLQKNIPVFCADEKRRLCKDQKLPWNFIIEGDNLQALYLLEKTHKGKVDCIYLDPPYNTGAHDWKYNNDYVDVNDAYRHSKWLSMMKTRLMLAGRLLNPEDSVLIVTIDEKEYLHLGCLLEELFPNATIQMVIDVINPRGTNRENEFSRVEEYIFFCRFGKARVNKTDNNMLGNTDETGKERVWYAFNRGNNLRASGNNQFYPIYINAQTKVIEKVGEPMPLETPMEKFPVYEGLVSVFPINKHGQESIWRSIPSTTREWIKKGYVKVSKYEEKNKRWTLSYISSGLQTRIEKGEIETNGIGADGSLDLSHIDSFDEKVSPRSVWYQKYHNATDYGASIIKKLIPNHHFPYPKSLYSVHDTLQFFLAGKKDAVVMDFFAGSGTTMHAVNLLNAEDGGNRICIMVTNNEISEKEEKRLTEKGLKKGDAEWENLGIAKYVAWPRITCSIMGKDVNGNDLDGVYFSANKMVKTQKRIFKQISFMCGNPTLKMKKQFVATCANGALPQNLVTEEKEYVVSDDEKHTTSILFDVNFADEWIAALEDKIHIKEFYVVTDKNSVFKKIKDKILELLGDIEIDEYDTIPMVNGFNANVKYFKCDWTPRKPEDYLLSNALALHIKEMIEIQNAIEIDNKKNVLILNKTDFKNIILDKNKYAQIERVWVNQNIVFNVQELKLLQEKGYKYIPKEFFGQELREVAE